MVIDHAVLDETLANARGRLLAERSAAGWWIGELSSSALSTATAAFTLHLKDRTQHSVRIARGIDWLVRNQNADGGWGDTVRSFGNISTTALCWAALSAGKPTATLSAANERAEAWLTRAAGDLSPAQLSRTIVRRYGKDHTFSVPILTMLALAGRLGAERDAWSRVPQLPFELAACPHRWFEWLQLPVVSYALPALIAIGQVRHHHLPTWNPITRLLRQATRGRTLRLLRAIQPESGGFLEATPLTSFVSMSLSAAGQADHAVVQRGVEFLERSQLPDGSWPIDTNLATWVTSLSINALHAVGAAPELNERDRQTIRDWLLGQQYRVEHPYTHAAPGGWAWTDLTGGVPDADDTPGALLALARLTPPDDRVRDAARAGVGWLLDLQNRDGGMPTFCRGWTGLPFDRSSADLTAHALLAFAAWRPSLADLQPRIDAATRRGLGYLIKTQRSDGSRAPLWFGNQHADEVENLTYGTSRILRLAALNHPEPGWEASLRRALAWLLATQNGDGGWGGRAGTPSSIEETAWAVEGLACGSQLTDRAKLATAVTRGCQWLAERTARGREFVASPIGFYFANLWYFEKLYPLIFTVAALERARALPRMAT
jgi:squalene-hopene/tetraprenyl-beta-curcumene cyclase